MTIRSFRTVMRPAALAAVLFASFATPQAFAQQLPQGYAAQVEVRLSQMEQQLREMRGQLEQSRFEQQRLQEQLDRALNDVRFRLDLLEGGEGQQGDAGSLIWREQPEERPADLADSTPSSGAFSPSLVQQGVSENQPAAPSAPPMSSSAWAAPLDLSGSARPQPSAGLSDASGTLGTMTFPSEGAARDVLGGAAQQAFENARNLLRNGDHGAAASAFESFLATHPEHPLASEAHYWLGEAHAMRGDMDRAARAFAQGYAEFPEGDQAMDSLFKLGMALAALGRQQDACTALNRFARDYPSPPPSIAGAATEERERLNC